MREELFVVDPETEDELHALGMHGDRASSSLRHVLTQAPPSLIAQMLGYATTHAEKVAAPSGATWKSYASGHYAAKLG